MTPGRNNYATFGHLDIASGNNYARKTFSTMSNVSTNTLLALIDNEDTTIMLSSTVFFTQGYT